MKQLAYLIFVLALTVPAFAQDTTNRTDAAGKKQGYWKKKSPEGQLLYTGQFRDGIPYGVFHYFYPDGVTKAVSQYSSDGKTTQTKTYFTNGRIMAEGKFVNEKREGLWKFYTETDGLLISEENYLDGKKDGISKNYYAGKGIAELSTFKNGIHEGLWEQYFPDGKVKFRCTYAADKKEGPVTGYSSSGQVVMSGTYKNGAPEGIWTYYDEKGKVTRKETYERGYRIKQEGEFEKDSISGPQ